ncbi:MAG: hypothetical protein KA792_02300 [Bacteroidales bacterium]|nr:hypothetical protein [Bacteroidales bacterium]
MKTEYLIQKLVKLLDKNTRNKFLKHLKSQNADLSYKLVLLCDVNLSTYQSPDTLCNKIYKCNDIKSRQNFNQLASYTFKLSSFLSRNYPSYLFHNISRIEHLVNESKRLEADYLAKILFELAEKIEDNQTLISLLKYLAQESFIRKEFSNTARYHKRLEEVLEREKTLNGIYIYFYKNFNVSVNNQYVISNFEKMTNYFDKYKKNKSKAVSFISRYSLYHILYYYRQNELQKPKNIRDLIKFEKEFDKYGYIIFPFPEDIQTKILYFRLNLSSSNLNNKEFNGELKKLMYYNETTPFWTVYNNLPEIYYINIKTTFYLSKYHYQIHRKDYYKIISLNHRKDIENLAERCNKLIKLYEKKEFEEQKSTLLNFKIIYSALMLLSKKKNIEIALKILYSLIETSKTKLIYISIDTIYMCLIIGNFAQGKYKQCIKDYRKYQTHKQKRMFIEENDMAINIYYYIAQYLDNGKQIYTVKLKEIFEFCKKNKTMKTNLKTIKELIIYFNIPN